MVESAYWQYQKSRFNGEDFGLWRKHENVMESACGCFTIMKFNRSFVINAVEDITFPSCHMEEELWTSY